MNNKITLNNLSETLAKSFDLSVSEAESGIRAFFEVVAEALSEGESVKIKGLGTFKAIGIEARESVDVSTGKRVIIPAHKRASFTPEKGLAEKVNAPFAAFDAVELADGITEDELAVIDSETVNHSYESVAFEMTDGLQNPLQEDLNPASPDASDVIEDSIAENEDDAVLENLSAEYPMVEETEEAEDDDGMADVAAADVAETHGKSSESDTEERESATEEQSHSHDEYVNIEYPDDVDYFENGGSRLRRGGMLAGFLLGIACVFVILGGIWCWYRFAPDSFDSVLGRPSAQPVIGVPQVASSSVETGGVVIVDTTSGERQSQNVVAEENKEVEKAAQVSTQPSDNKKAAEKKDSEPVYDTISKTRFLTTMAREHYGSYHLWPYIYIENQAILGHPDRIRPGTQVVIPPAEKYGINAKDKNCIEKAKKMGVEIYAKFK